MMPIRMRCLRPLAVSSGAVGPRPDPPGRIPQPASRRDLRWLALDGRTDGDVADLDVIRLLDGKGDGAGDGVGGDGDSSRLPLTPGQERVLLHTEVIREHLMVNPG